MDDQHLTLPELARCLRVSDRHVQRLLETGDGPPAIRLGRRIIFNRAAVQRWLEARTSGSRPLYSKGRSRSPSTPTLDQPSPAIHGDGDGGD
jgi:excisionase family DNA binding protein